MSTPVVAIATSHRTALPFAVSAEAVALVRARSARPRLDRSRPGARGAISGRDTGYDLVAGAASPTATSPTSTSPTSTARSRRLRSGFAGLHRRVGNWPGRRTRPRADALAIVAATYALARTQVGPARLCAGRSGHGGRRLLADQPQLRAAPHVLGDPRGSAQRWACCSGSRDTPRPVGRGRWWPPAHASGSSV